VSKMQLKVFLIGSCYSGYMFKEKIIGRQASENIKLVFQHQHDSLISIMTDPYMIDLTAARSKYQWDFNHFAESVFKKNIFDKLSEYRPDYLLLDLYAEAICPLIMISEQCYLTKNYYIETSTVYDQLSNYRIIDPFDDERKKLFDIYAVEFLKKIKEIVPDIKIVLLRAKAAESLKRMDGSWSPFKDIELVRRQNNLRSEYEEKIIRLEDVYVLNMADKYPVASELIYDQYNYAISSNHFDVSFYLEEYSLLKNIILKDILYKEKLRSKYFNQAIVLIAKKDPKMTYLLAKMYKDFFKVYVCVDRKLVSDIFNYNIINNLNALPNVSVSINYDLQGGTFSELSAIINVSDAAFSDTEVHCVHYTSDLDMPIVPVNRLYSFFESNNGKSYLNLFADGNRGDMARIEDSVFRYYYFDANSDNSEMKRKVGESVDEQKRKGIFRNKIGEFTELYKGIMCGTISRNAYMYCKEYVKKHPEYVDDIKYIRQKSEFFFHTVLYNSEIFKNKTEWGKRGGLHSWDWDEDVSDFRRVDEQLYRKYKKMENSLFIRNVVSSETKLVETILKDIGSPYCL